MSAKVDNIFWKMIIEQKRKGQHKIEPQEYKSKVAFSKPLKKSTASFLDKIEKFSFNPSTHSTYNKKPIKNKDTQEDEISKLSTFNKIIKLQNLCKEMISAKERILINNQ